MSLWHHRAFMRLWLAQVLSNAGTQITSVALPLTAVLVLDVTTEQMSLLVIAGSLPNFLFGLFAGVWIDRVPRRPVLVGADIGRAILFASIPAAAYFDALTFTHLLLVLFATATLSVFFIIASVSILPALVEGDRLVEANGKLATSDAVLTIAGPGIAGALIQLVGAPIALIVDAVSYVLSALCLRGIAAPESPAGRQPEPNSLWTEIGAGIRELIRTPLLRALTISAGAGSLGAGIQGTVFVLFLTRGLDMPPSVIGLVFACGGVGSFAGALAAGRMAQRIGTGRAVMLGSLLWAAGSLVLPLAGLGGQGILFAGLGQAMMSAGAVVYSVNQMSLRQQITPVDLMGRVTAARRFLIFSLATAGAVLGGQLGTRIGLRATLIAGGVAFGVSFLLLLASPVRLVRGLSAQEGTP